MLNQSLTLAGGRQQPPGEPPRHNISRRPRTDNMMPTTVSPSYCYYYGGLFLLLLSFSSSNGGRGGGLLLCLGFIQEEIVQDRLRRRSPFYHHKIHRGSERNLLGPSSSSVLLQPKQQQRSASKLLQMLPRSTAVAVSLPFTVPAKDTTIRLFALKGRKGKDTHPSSSDDVGGGNSDNDSNEWKAVLAAIQMYKAAYGDLKVPQRFVVPNMKPWPKPAWGMRLGKVVQNIRATGKYVVQNPQRRQALNEMGFVWQMRLLKQPGGPGGSASLEQVYTALQVYAEQNEGSVAVPLSFVVPASKPWPESVKEMPLGRQLTSFVPKALEQPENEEWQVKFAQLGFPPGVAIRTSSDDNSEDDENGETISDSASSGENAADISDQVMSPPDLRFQKVYAALKAYKKLNGDLLVPQPFVIPESDDWPKDTWGIRLGARVNTIRSQGTFVNKNPERRQLLEDLGFVWNVTRSEHRRQSRKTASDEASEEEEKENYTDEEGDDSSLYEEDDDSDDLSSLFDQQFDLKAYTQDSGDKSKASWGFEGGGDLQKSAQVQEQRQREEEVYTPPRTLQESMAYARQLAIDVGIVQDIAANYRVIKQKIYVDVPWFNDDFGGDFVFDDVLEALTLYKSFYGNYSNLTMNFDFVVPTPLVKEGFLDDDDDLTSFAVDPSARAARAIAKFEEEGDFDRSEDLIAAEIKRLQQQVGALEAEESVLATKIPVDGKVAKWPEHLAEMALGSIVSRIRDGSLEVKHLKERKAKLDAIDFDWGEDKYFIDIPFEKTVCAMYAYYLIRGDTFAHEDFVMPNDDPWPEALAGFEIGKAVKRIRELQNFFEAYHPEKVSMLRMFEFMWFPSHALPLDPSESADDEMLKLTGLGHPDYAKLRDLPMGLPDKIIADGPFYETDDPRLWWRVWHNWDCVKDYWYALGRRDNAFVLRSMGYKKMAEEHEAKYGPGLFQQMEWTMASLADPKALKGKSPEEKEELLRTLKYYRQEMKGCTDISEDDRVITILDLKAKIQDISQDLGLDFDDEDDEEWEYEKGDEKFKEKEGAGDDDEEDIISRGFRKYDFSNEEFRRQLKFR